MKIYVASSWRNSIQPIVVDELRAAGHSVYDFRNPPNKSGVGWEQIASGVETWTFRQFKRVLEHPIAAAGFASDMDALRGSDVCVLVLPCGNSAHLEAGWAVGAGKPVVVYCPTGMKFTPELMYLMFGAPQVALCETLEELLEALAEVEGVLS